MIAAKKKMENYNAKNCKEKDGHYYLNSNTE